MIEDEPVLRLDALAMVEQAGFEGIEALDVDDAIRTLETRPDIRIVYMDLDMPRGVQGIELAAAIRDRWPPIEIILTAATFSRENLSLPVRAEFFAKPFRRSDAVATMQRMMEGHA
ncbi:response regulator [Sphingomonas lacusdianchii]|uniref:response regulator n=1 Tax=Sphingomonas lacusdianchii TaxID=2917992 RepID=UPI001F57B178